MASKILKFIVGIAALAILIVLVTWILTGPVDAAELEPLVVLNHISDPTNGSSFDFQTNYFGVGATLTAPKLRLQLDMTLGRKQDVHVRGCDGVLGHDCGTTWAGSFEMRWHPHLWAR